MTGIADLVRQARVGAGMSQAELALRAGTSQPALARYETGVSLPTLSTLERLLGACGQRLELRTTRIEPPGHVATSVRGQLGARSATLRRHRPRILEAARAHGVRRIRVFGSLARGEATAASDVDFLVDLGPGRTLLDLAAFRRDVEAVLAFPVDVATADMLKERIRATVEREAIPL